MTRRKFITLLGGTPKDGLAFGMRFRAGQTAGLQGAGANR
jgi:hypothetical protein